MDQLIGKFLGNRYEILERIGSGGMAVVYKAKCHWLNRFVAIKILKDDLAHDEEFRRRFREESQAVAMLSHPNIVSIYDVSRTEESSEPDYIVMELIEGITLKQYMQKKGGQLSWKESLHFITQIMKGLSHAHSRGIIHRDIKPHNIMVLRDGSVKVADFGIARLMSNAQSTMTQEALGSVHYISPEQARGSRIDARSDIYSAGVVLYEMLTGRLPYEGDSPVAVAIQHINSIPLSPREIDPSIPEALEEITMKAMAPDPNKRYLTADAMLTDLEEFRKNPNISFDYTNDDLMVGDGDEPTQPIGAKPVQSVVQARLSHTAGSRSDTGSKRTAEEYEDEDDYDDDNGLRRTVIVIAAVVFCLVGIAYFLWVNVFSGMMETGDTITVPNVIGYTMEEARALPQVLEGQFILIEGKQVESDEVPPGEIVNQSPAADDVVKVGAHEITVDISVSKTGLVMPDCYNKDQRIALSSLNAMGLEVAVEEDYSEDITKGKVMAQEPAAEEPLEEGDAVTITVSKGPKPKQVTMLPVTGVSQEEATRIITGLGLRVGTVTPMPSEKYAEGLICYQSVGVNTSIEEGSVVDLGISTGAEAVEPPDVSVSPDPVETAEPTPTPEVGGKLTRKEGTVDLPNDRETVVVRVTVGGVEKYQAEFNTTMRRARYTVEGSGVQEIVVYIDGVEAKRYTEDFDA